MPGPMTIVDTIADSHYGDKVKLAMAFAELLNQEARALEAQGVDVIQFDEPAFNVYMDDVKRWGIEALHRAIDGLKCRTAVHICYGYGIKANIDWKNSLGTEWRQYEEIFPGAGEEPPRPGLGRVHPLARADEPAEAARRQGRAGRRDRRGDRQGRDAGGDRRRDRRGAQVRAEGAAVSRAPTAAWRRWSARSPRPSSRRSAPGRRWRAAALLEQMSSPRKRGSTT